MAVSCPLLSSQQSNHSVTWYRNGSAIPLMADSYLRIHQHRNLLWLVPAKKEDSGFYECQVGYVRKLQKRIIDPSVDISECDLKRNQSIYLKGR